MEERRSAQEATFMQIVSQMIDTAEMIARLGEVGHFKGLKESDLRAIVTAGVVRRYLAKSYIFFQDEPCAGMFVLLSGRAHLCSLGPKGQQNILAVVEPVIMFNEVAVLDGGPNPVTAQAVDDCTLWRVSCQDFQTLLSRYPQTGLGLLRVLARRNRLLISRYEDLSFRSVLARTAKLLLDLSDNGAHPVNRRQHSVQQMASQVASVPEAVSRSLNYLKRQGVIELTRARVGVRQPKALARLAQVDPYGLRG